MNRQADFGYNTQQRSADFGAIQNSQADFGGADFGKLIVSKGFSGMYDTVKAKVVANKNLVMVAAAALAALAFYAKKTKGTYNFSKLFMK
jgi:hypothetical protein